MLIILGYHGGTYVSQRAGTTISYQRGYLSGGYTTVPVKTVNILVYETEAMLASAQTLTTAKDHGSSVNNSANGYTIGGYNQASVYYKDIDSVLFTTDVFTIKSATLSANRASTASFSSDTFGYVCGGSTGSASSTIEKLRYSDETVLTSNALPGTMNVSSGVFGKYSGYVCGGDYNGSRSDIIVSVNFLTETPTVTGYKLNVARYNSASVQSANYGYIWGGRDASNTLSTEIDGVDLVNGTSMNVAATISIAREAATGVSSYDKGYVCGGWTTASSTSINGIRFDTGAAINPSVTLATATQALFGVTTITQLTATIALNTASYEKGYIVGGVTVTPTMLAAIDTFDLDLDLKYTVTSTLHRALTQATGVNNAYYSFICGGSSDNSNTVNTIDAIRIDNDTNLFISSTLSVNRRLAAGLSEAYVGYIAGGYNGSHLSSVDKFTYATATIVASANALPYTRSYGASHYTTTIGYISSGYLTGVTSDQTNTITFADDTTSTLSQRLSEKRYETVGVMSNNRGYICGGASAEKTTGILNIDALRYLDNTTYNPAAKLITTRTRSAGISGRSRGAVCGGWNGTSDYNQIDGINFTTELAYDFAIALTTSSQYKTGANAIQQIAPTELSVAEEGVSIPQYDKGYVCGGANATVTTDVMDIFHYDTETRLSSLYGIHNAYIPYGNLNSAYKGYVCGGSTISSNYYRTISTVYFDTDTTNQNKSMSIGRAAGSGLSSLVNGYLAGGLRESGYTTNYNYTWAKINFATETYNDIAAISTFDSTYTLSTESNVNGYQMGDYNYPYSSQNINRINFATETFTQLSQLLTVRFGFGTSVRSTNVGYAVNGWDGNAVANNIDGFDFALEAPVTFAIVLGTSRMYQAGMSASDKGLICGGFDNVSVEYSVCEKITYATNARSGAASGLSTVRQKAVGLTSVVQSAPIMLSSLTPRAYIAGGLNAGVYLSSVQRFYFDTLFVDVHGYSLSTGKSFTSGINGITSGYFACGKTGNTSSVQSLEKINYSEDSISITAISFVDCYANLATVSSSTSGYGLGGYLDYWGYNYKTGIDKLSFDTETVTLTTNLPYGWAYAASSYSLAAGYLIGGSRDGYNDTGIGKLLFNTETFSVLANVLPISTRQSAELQSNNTGYTAGGIQNSTYTNEIYGLRFADETTTNPSAVLVTARNYCSGASSSTVGFAFGGYTGSVESVEIDGLRFDNETLYNYGNNLSAPARYASGTISTVQQTANTDITNPQVPTVSKGYFAGGYNGTNVYYTVEAYNHWLDYISTLNQSLMYNGYFGAGAASDIKGYFLSSYTGSITNTFTGLRFDIETTSSLILALSTARYRGGSVSFATNSYFLGGNTGSASGIIDKLTFADESISVIAATCTAKYAAASFMSDIKGYFAGGSTTGSDYLSSIDTIDPSSDTSNVLSAALTIARLGSCGIYSSIKGYTVSGYTGAISTKINGLSFADDTATTVTATLGFYNTASSTSTFSGYIVGGNNGSTNRATVTRFKYSTETVPTTGVTISVARYGVTGISNGL